MSEKFTVTWKIVSEKHVETQAKIDARRIECAKAVIDAFLAGSNAHEEVEEYRRAYMLQAAFNDVVESETSKLTHLDKQE